MTSITGSARTLSPEELSKFGAGPAADKYQDVSKCIIQVTAALRAGANADAVRQRNPTRVALRDAHRPNLLDVQTVVSFARVHGLAVVDLDRPPRMVVLEGTVGDITAAFGTDVKVWEQRWPWPAGHGVQRLNERKSIRFRLRPCAELQVPDQLARIVQGVFGIDNRKEARMHMWADEMHMWRKQPHAALATLNPGKQRNQPRSYAVEDVAKIYDFPPPTAKEGCEQTIAILALGGRLDRKEVAQRFGDLNVFEVPVDCKLPQLGEQSDGDFEVALDVHVIASLVPRASIVIYYVENTSQGFINGLARAIYNESLPASIISISWGSYEESWTNQAIAVIEDLLKDAKALNISVCCASGDLGAWDGDPSGGFHVDYPASSPHVLSCGGTTLGPESEDQAPPAEMVWSEPRIVWNQSPSEYLASGGGKSTRFGQPDWQCRPGDLAPGQLGKRGVPDVASFADPRNGFTISVAGKVMRVGGTSAAAPLWAGLIARINENLGKPVGFLNPLLYRANSKAFRDITRGRNGEWTAGEGWDFCTGLGRPYGQALLDELKKLLLEAPVIAPSRCPPANEATRVSALWRFTMKGGDNECSFADDLGGRKGQG